MKRIGISLALAVLASATALDGASAQPRREGDCDYDYQDDDYGYDEDYGGPRMMGSGTMGPGTMGGGYGTQQGALNLTTSDIEASLDRYVVAMGNSRLKAGSVTEADANTITAEIVTVEGNAVVQRFNVDRRTGFWQPAQ